MASQITTLTTLDLSLWSLEPAPTTSQVLSVLASNPTLHKVTLSMPEDNDDRGVNPPPRVSLRHLKELKLDGYSQYVFGFLDRLDHPKHMDQLDITLECAVEDLSHLIGPYLRHYLRHRGGSRGGLGLSLGFPLGHSIVLSVGDVGGIDFYIPAPARMNRFMTIAIDLNQSDLADTWNKAALDLISHSPREDIIYFHAYGDRMVMEDISAQLPNLRGLHLDGMPLSNLDGGGEIFPSLQYVLLDEVCLGDDDWGPLATFLDWRISSGNRLHTLVLVGSYWIDPAVWGSLERSVQEFAVILLTTSTTTTTTSSPVG